MQTSGPLFDPAKYDEAAQPDLDSVQEEYGFVPNLAGILGHAPEVLRGYLGLAQSFEKCSLGFPERQVVLIAASVANSCEYCVAAHSTGAKAETSLGPLVEQVRSGRPLSDTRLEALRLLTTDIVERRGWPQDDTVSRFLAAGFERQQLLEVVLGVALKTLTNYVNHLAAPEVDPQFSAEAWSAAEKQGELDC